jgi:hypothetical protein
LSAPAYIQVIRIICNRTGFCIAYDFGLQYQIMAQSKPSRSSWWLVLGIVLLCVPLFLSVTWGAYFGDAAYHTYQVAQFLGDDLPHAFTAGKVTQARLYVGLMAIAGTYAPQIGLVAGALGWGATAVLVLFSLRAVGRPLAAIIAALLLVLNPLVLTTAGTEYSWVLALGWAALALTVLPWGSRKGAVWLKLILLLLLLGLHFNAATILFALTLLAIDVYKGRTGWLPFILVAALALLWGLVSTPRFGSSPLADPFLWLRDGYAFFATQQLYWLFIPFVLAGLWDVWTWETAESASGRGGHGSGIGARTAPTKRTTPTEGQELFVLLLLWSATAFLTRSTAAPVIVTVVAIALAGLGAAWFTRKVLTPGRFEIDQRRAALLVPALLTMPLLLISLVNLWEFYNARPVQQAELQDQAATWLLENADPEATLYAPPRAGYGAGLATLPALVDRIRDDNIDEVYEQLLDYVPDYIVSDNNFAWDYITRTTWFQDHYQARTQFMDGYAPDSPVAVWEYTPSPYDEGQREELTAVVDDRFALVGYQFEPQVITPGDDVFLTLYLQALEPVDHGFITVVHLSAPDGWVWAWREERTPRSLPGQWWEPGQVIPERIRLQTTEDIPLGAYDLQVFWRAGDDKTKWPIVRDGDDNVLDRIFLGHVVAPPPVDAGQATPVKAQFGDTILLDSFEVSPAVPGEALDVTLFWEALNPPAADYTVFVHLVDADGQVVAAHDGMPGENSFPTRAWQPGLLVSDKHQLDLPADLAPGTYQVNVGLYLLETGERLPVWDAGGIEQDERSLPLAAIEIDNYVPSEQ